MPAPHIFLVDDNLPCRAALTAFLEEEGYQVTQAADGQAALTLLSTCVPDALFTDYSMPGLTGLELLRAVKQDWPSLPVVLYTATMDGEVERRAREAGAVAYLRKPLELALLLGVLGSLPPKGE